MVETAFDKMSPKGVRQRGILGPDKRFFGPFSSFFWEREKFMLYFYSSSHYPLVECIFSI